MSSDIKSLSFLGPRVAIIGPSNSGKSTLANAISHKTSYPAIHLDQLYHLPGTHWQARPKSHFLDLHRAAIDQECWIIEGNYSSCLKERMDRATGVILLDISLPLMLMRYFRRTVFQRERIGGVLAEHQRDRINSDMLKYLLFTTPKNRAHHRTIFDELTMPKVALLSAEQVKRCWKEWALK